MALHQEDKKMVEKLAYTPKGYYPMMLFEFVESGMEAASVDVPLGRTAKQAANSLRSAINHDKEKYANICVVCRDEKVYLLKK